MDPAVRSQINKIRAELNNYKPMQPAAPAQPKYGCTVHHENIPTRTFEEYMNEKNKVSQPSAQQQQSTKRKRDDEEMLDAIAKYGGKRNQNMPVFG